MTTRPDPLRTWHVLDVITGVADNLAATGRIADGETLRATLKGILDQACPT